MTTTDFFPVAGARAAAACLGGLLGACSKCVAAETLLAGLDGGDAGRERARALIAERRFLERLEARHGHALELGRRQPAGVDYRAGDARRVVVVHRVDTLFAVFDPANAPLLATLHSPAAGSVHTDHTTHNARSGVPRSPFPPALPSLRYDAACAALSRLSSTAASSVQRAKSTWPASRWRRSCARRIRAAALGWHGSARAARGCGGTSGGTSGGAHI